MTWLYVNRKFEWPICSWFDMFPILLEVDSAFYPWGHAKLGKHLNACPNYPGSFVRYTFHNSGLFEYPRGMRNEKNWSDQIYQSSLEGKVSCRNTAYANKEMIFEDQDECLMVLVITVNLMNPMPLLLKGFHGSRMGSQNLKLTEVEIKPNLKLTHNDTRVMFKFLFDFKIFCTVLPPPLPDRFQHHHHWDPLLCSCFVHLFFSRLTNNS